MRNRRRRFESLEPRRLLAAYINEFLFDPLFGTPDTDQYVELRGEPNATLAPGTYLAIVESEATPSAGEIHGLFDLSGLAFGQNGFLVLLPQNSPFTPDPQANTLQSTEPGFGALPGDIYSDSHPISERIDFIYGSNSLFLIQTDVSPELGDDIDANNDGFVDPAGPLGDWNVMDSVSTLWGLSDGYGYGQIVFVDNHGVFEPAITSPEGAAVVHLDGTGYIGRIGNSTGSSSEDWVAGVVKDDFGGEFLLRLAGDVHGRPRPIVLHGRGLDSLGSENFTGAVRASFFEDFDGDGSRNGTEPGVPGTVLLADTNGNGVRDLLTTTIEADDFEEDIELNNLTPGVTLSTAVEDNVIIGFDIQAVQDFWSPEGVHNFAHTGIDFFNSTRRLRMDFYRPAQSVSIDVIGNSNTTLTYGRLEVFDAEGNSLRMIRTEPLGDNARQRLTINMGSDLIAYAVAYPDETYLDSSPFGQLDKISFSVPEAIATANAAGIATLNFLDPGDYNIVPLHMPLGLDYVFDPLPIHIEKYENFDLSAPARLNEPPVLVDGEFSVAESTVSGAVVGNVVAQDLSSQTIRYTLLEGDEYFTIGTTTGELQLRSGAGLDHESLSEIVVRVRATDDAPNPLSSEASFTIHVTDVNEPPSLADFHFEIFENPEAGLVIGTIAAHDPDLASGAIAGYRIAGANPGQAFAINGVTGELSVNHAAAFDYEASRSLSVTIEAFDGGSPSLVASRQITVDLLDRNEAPRIDTTELTVGELAASGTIIGRVAVYDPDALQSHTFSWADGFTTDTFTIDSTTGDIAIAEGVMLDFATDSEHFLEVRAEDSGAAAESVTQTIRIRLTDQNNPPRINDVELAVDENAEPGTLVGIVTASDPDVDSQLVFAIVGGAGESRFTIDSASGEIRVADQAVLDYESQSQWEIEVQVWDDGQPIAFSTRALSVVLNDRNDPPMIAAATLTVPENVPGGLEVGAIQFSDPDAGDAPVISLLDSPDADLFTLDAGGVLGLRNGAELDFESVAEYVLSVQVDDGQSPPVVAEIVVSVLDANDPPLAAGVVDAIDMMAGDVFERILASDLFADVDIGQQLEFAVRGADAVALPEWLAFDAVTGRLTAAPWNLDQGEHHFYVVATDTGTPPMAAETPFTIRVGFNQMPWHNTATPEDVNNDGAIRSIDALAVINFLNNVASAEVPLEQRSRPGFLDVNGNNRVEPIDALRIINFLNRQNEGSGEAGATAPAMAAPPSMAMPSWIEEETRRKSEVQDAALLEYMQGRLRSRRS